MTYEDYCEIEGLPVIPGEKKAYEAGQRDVAQDIASCFGIAIDGKNEKRFLARLQIAANIKVEK